MMNNSSDTIVAIATPPGRGGVGIVRISGNKALNLAKKIIGFEPKPRYAHFGDFYLSDGSVLDQGISIFFPGPFSFTGEDVFEIQAHGGPVLLNLILEEVIELGARMANPGEFSERAFINDKIDLTQAEAISDIIDATSKEAARAAVRSLQGEFSSLIRDLTNRLISLRTYVEAAIDFPEEEIDFLSDGKVENDLRSILNKLDSILESARQGTLIKEGMTIVIAGAPNAGKSSLLNLLSGLERAIVTDIAGTTRDTIKEYLHIDGMPIHLIDTAGLRQTEDTVEKIGVEKAWNEIKQADHILLMVDASKTSSLDPREIYPDFFKHNIDISKITLIRNKIDLTLETEPNISDAIVKIILMSTKTGAGLESLKEHLKKIMGYQGNLETAFTARKRHLDSLMEAKKILMVGLNQLTVHFAGELLAEDLKFAQAHLNTITGQFTSDDLLGEIFSSFCIGK